MRTGNVLFSAVHLCIVIAFLILGAFLIGVAALPELRFKWFEFLRENTSFFYLLGGGSLCVGVMLCLGFYFLNRKQYYQVSLQNPKTTVELSLIQSYAEQYWQNIFPEQEMQVDVLLHKDQKMEFFIEMPPLSFEEQGFVLEKAERELGEILEKNLGYTQEFLVSATLRGG